MIMLEKQASSWQYRKHISVSIFLYIDSANLIRKIFILVLPKWFFISQFSKIESK